MKVSEARKLNPGDLVKVYSRTYGYFTPVPYAVLFMRCACKNNWYTNTKCVTCEMSKGGIGKVAKVRGGHKRGTLIIDVEHNRGTCTFRPYMLRLHKKKRNWVKI
jgi:hypothetical protein